MKTCGSCFRYCEDTRDVETIGRKNYRGYDEMYVQPRPGSKRRCTGVDCPDDADENTPACTYHEYRWWWNLKIWWKWHFRRGIVHWWYKHVRVPLGGLRKPVPLLFKDGYDVTKDTIIPNSEPICPHCGEYPYDDEQCVFCGQRFAPESDRDISRFAKMLDSYATMFEDSDPQKRALISASRAGTSAALEEMPSLSPKAQKAADDLFAEE